MKLWTRLCVVLLAVGIGSCETAYAEEEIVDNPEELAKLQYLDFILTHARELTTLSGGVTRTDVVGGTPTEIVPRGTSGSGDRVVYIRGQIHVVYGENLQIFLSRLSRDVSDPDTADVVTPARKASSASSTAGEDDYVEEAVLVLKETDQLFADHKFGGSTITIVSAVMNIAALTRAIRALK